MIAMFIDTISEVFSLIFNHPVLFPFLSICITLSMFILFIRFILSFIGVFGFSPKSVHDESSCDLYADSELICDEASLSSQSIPVDQAYCPNSGACLSSHNFDKSRYQTKLPKYNK